MNSQNIRDLIKQELPKLVREDKEIQELVLMLAKDRFADRKLTDDRFNAVLEELRRDREEQNGKWEEQNRKWNESTAEQNRKWDEQNRKWDEQNRKWDEQNRKWNEFTAEQNRKWDEQNRKWDESTAEQNRKWDESTAEQNRKWDEQNKRWEQYRIDLDRTHEEIMAMATKLESSIGALGARWGLQSEQAFRNGLAAILEKSFKVNVITVTEYDEKGEVFGRPDQVELDLIVSNGVLIIAEIKSSIDKAGMYSFERKARFYEKMHQQKAHRLLVISPMVDPRAVKVAEKLGIEVYSHSFDIKSL